MTQYSKKRPYDLEERTFLFAKEVRLFVKTLEKSIANNEDAKQVIRSSGSIGANYIEANESFSKKDFVFRAKISRKEAKESSYWLRLIYEPILSFSFTCKYHILHPNFAIFKYRSYGYATKK